MSLLRKAALGAAATCLAGAAALLGPMGNAGLPGARAQGTPSIMEFRWDPNRDYRKLYYFTTSTVRLQRAEYYFILKPKDRKTAILKLALSFPKNFESTIDPKNVKIDASTLKREGDEAEAAPEPTRLAAMPALIGTLGADQPWVLPTPVVQGWRPALQLLLHVLGELLQVLHHQLGTLEHRCVDALQHGERSAALHQIGVVDIAATEGRNPRDLALPMEGLRNPPQTAVVQATHACSACCCSISRSSW